MKRFLILMIALTCTVGIFADAPVEGGYIGGDMTGVTVDGETVSGVLVQLSPTDMPIDTYVGIGVTDTYLKGGLVFTPWEVAEVPLGIYAGGGILLDTMTDGELVKSLSGYKTSGIAEVGIVLIFTEYAQLRTGYAYYDSESTVNLGMVVGYNKNGLGVYK